MRSSASLLLRLSPAIDAVLIAGVFAFLSDAHASGDRAGIFITLLAVPFWLWAVTFVGVYESQRVEPLTTLVRKVLTANAIVFTTVGLTAWGIGGLPALQVHALIAGVLAIVLVGEKLAVYSVLHFVRRRDYDVRWVCIVGAWEWAQNVAAQFSQHPHWGLRVSCVGIGPATNRFYLRYPDADVAATDLAQILSTEVIDEVLIAVRPQELANESATLRICEQMGVMARVLPDTRDIAVPGRFETPDRELTLSISGGFRDEWRLTLKRLIDIVGGIALIVLLMPLLLASAALVKLSSAGPILFTQDRVGLHGRRFKVYKFRTMIQGAEAMLPSLQVRSIMKGPVFKDPQDVRVTPIGRVLRKFSLDELPQLFNVVKGDMSLVGPRPLPVHESVAISGSYRRRFSMRPGITCLWQINGRSNVDYATWMNYDLQYVDQWSLGLDARLLLKTVPAVLSGRGAC